MKKITFISTALIAGAMFLASCGGGDSNGLLTQEEFDKKVEEMTAERIAEIGPQLDEQCEAQFEAMVEAKVDSIIRVATGN
jgi:hypothetical protein